MGKSRHLAARAAQQYLFKLERNTWEHTEDKVKVQYGESENGLALEGVYKDHLVLIPQGPQCKKDRDVMEEATKMINESLL